MLLCFCLPLLAFLALTSCETMESATKLATVIGQGTGVITGTQAESIRKTATAVSRSAEEFTPEQEYYIGRSVGAVVLAKYRAYDNDQVNQYVNLLGQTLAQASDLPGIFGGYHFLVLNSDDINAFATPSGLVFVTRGLMRCCRNEDALAAVLAHEIGHIQLRHGMQAIEKARVTEALTTLAAEGAKTFGSREVAALTQTFGGTITDITNTLINNGYARSSEYRGGPGGRGSPQARRLQPQRPGGDAHGDEEEPESGRARFRQDPSGAGRPDCGDSEGRTPAYAAVPAPAARQQRFQQALGEI